jgi:hypothetical protein
MTPASEAATRFSPESIVGATETLPVAPYRANTLPVIDYDSHPAYGRLFSRPSWRERLAAISTFSRSFLFVAVRRLVDYENVPLLSKESGGKLSLGFALRYLVMLARVRGNRFLRTLTGQRKAAAPASPLLLRRLRADGVACLRFSAEEIAAIRAATAPGFVKIDERRASIPIEKRKFDDNVYWFARSRDAQVFATVEDIFRRYGILDTASAYLGRPVGVKHINPQINDEEYAFWKRQFPDTDVPDARTTYLHIDATYGMLKCAIYIHDIPTDGGPFCYVRGSHRAKIGWFEGMVRRTNDFCGFSGRKPEARRKFMALPHMLRMKADFGGDILDESPESKLLMDGHFAITSDHGNCVLFDGHGIHRGGMVNKGERRCVFILLAEV